MKKWRSIWETCIYYKFWLFILILTDILFIYFFWLIDTELFRLLVWLMIACTFCLFLFVITWISIKEMRYQNVLFEFWKNPDEVHEMQAIKILPKKEAIQIQKIAQIIRENETLKREQIMNQEDYEEYIESWVHEIKIPLSFITLMLDNRKEEMSSTAYKRMETASNHIQEYIDQILYYARLKAIHKDYLFEYIFLEECLEDVLLDYQFFFQEENIKVKLDITKTPVVTDKKGLCFMISQIISNSIKYINSERKDSELVFYTKRDADLNQILFCIKDNGIGIKTSDIPFVFDKGFTGDVDEKKKKSTGMGLYLVKQMAKDLNIQLEIDSEYGKGVEVIFKFPIVQVKKDEIRNVIR